MTERYTINDLKEAWEDGYTHAVTGLARDNGTPGEGFARYVAAKKVIRDPKNSKKAKVARGEDLTQ